MGKTARIIVIICLIIVVAFLVTVSLIRHPYTEKELISSPENAIAEKEKLSPESVEVIAEISDGNDIVCIYEANGTTSYAHATAWLFGGRYSLVTGELLNIDTDSDTPSYDPAEGVNFRLSSNTETKLYEYRDGTFSLVKSEKMLSETLKSTVIRAITIVIIAAAVIYLGAKDKKKKEEK